MELEIKEKQLINNQDEVTNNEIGNQISKLKDNILKTMKNKEYNDLEYISLGINDLLKKVYFNSTLEFMKNINLSTKDKFIFYLKISECKNISATIKYELIPSIIIQFINKNKGEFLNLLSEYKILDDFIIWFKSTPSVLELNSDILEEIFKIPKIKREVLSDSTFYMRNNDYKLFNLLPKDCRSAIAFYNYRDISKLELNLKELYSKYFSDILEEKEELELIKDQIKEVKKPDIFQLGIVKMIPFYNFLNSIIQDKNCFVYVKNMIENSGLDFSIILKFFSKYNKAPFFEKLCKKQEKYNVDLIKKIEYLSYENCLLNVQEINDLEVISFSSLKVLPKDKSDSIILNIPGGPLGSQGLIFKDGYKREIRRIDLDGKMVIFDIKDKTHEFAVKYIYPEIKFNDYCSMAIERSIEAVKQLSSITFIIENNACYVVCNKNLSEEQIHTLNNLKVVNSNKCRFGIIIYDFIDNNYKVAYNGENVNFDKMLEYMNSLNEKSKTI